VTAECRTRRLNCDARLRRAGFLNEDFNISCPGPPKSCGRFPMLNTLLSWMLQEAEGTH
jgi:hypothetical protein